MISRSTIDRILQTAVIEDVVGEFVQLKRSGSAYKGLSPFSREKTPSFFVVPSKNIFKDFSSGKGGNVVDFVMEHEKLTFPEALRWLAAKYNIEIEEDAPNEQELVQKSEREQLSIVTEWASRFFQQQLWETDHGQAVGHSYFAERGFRDDIIRKFQLGYCPDEWDSMTKAALDQGYSLDYLKKAGLTRERDGVPYDFFRGRVMFPIHNVSGKTIAFGGRTLKAEKEIAKYFNSPESELYVKNQVLYGLYQAKSAIVKDDVCLLVEGYTDVISLHQSGVENTVASSGTSLTEGQIRQIRRYTQNITILYDGDSAGIKASFRGIDMILKEGMNVKVLLFPDGDDPDSFARKHSSDEIMAFIHANSKDFITFKTHLLLDEAGKDPVKRAGLIRSIVESIALMPDAITRSVYVQECSRLMDIQEQVVLGELNKRLLKEFKKQQSTDPEAPEPVLDEGPKDGIPDGVLPVLKLEYQEKDLVRLLLTYGERSFLLSITNEEGLPEEHPITVAEYIVGNLQQDEINLEHSVYKRIYEEYTEIIGIGQLPELNRFTQHTDHTISRESSTLLVSPYTMSDNWTARHQIYPETEEMLLKKAAKDCVFRFKLRKVQQISEQLTQDIAAHENDEEKLDALLREKMLLDSAKQQIAKYFGTVIMG
jgi:DNA primase